MQTSYLYRAQFGSKQPKAKNRRAHIWIDAADDTACRQWSTGGIVRQNKYKHSDSPDGLAICSMCAAVMAKRSFRQKRQQERVEAYEAGLVLWE